MISFTVYGEPATAGSKTGFYNKKLNRVLMTPASKKTKPWMQEVSCTAKAEYQGPLLTGPIRYRMKFYFQRPSSHFGSGRNAGNLKSSAPKYHTKKPDAIKLARAVEDALTGIVWKDDSQCYDANPVKAYTDGKSRVEIEIEEITENDLF